MMSEVDQYEAEAEAARNRIADNLAELSDRLSPSRLLGEAKATLTGSVRTRGHAAADGVAAFVRDNPVALAAVGALLSAALLGRTHSRHGRVAGEPSRIGRGWSGARRSVGQSGEWVRERARAANDVVRPRAAEAGAAIRDTAARARSAAVDAGQSIRSGAAHAAEYAEERWSDAVARWRPIGHEVGETLERARDRTFAYARQGREQAAEAIDDNPLGVVAVSFGVGALLGAVTAQDEQAEPRSRAF